MRQTLPLIRLLIIGLIAPIGLAGCGDGSSGGSGSSPPGQLRVCAAASLTDLLPQLDAAWRADDPSRPAIVPVLAASGVLARQLAEGMPADVFISANAEWIDFADDAGAIVPGSRRALFATRLVMIAPASTPAPPPSADVAALLAALPDTARLAIADPGAAPAGDWTRRALTARGLWQAAERRSLNLPDVRAALAAVVAGEVPYGFVYAADAQAAGERVRVVAVFDEARVVYHGAVVRRAANATAAAAFLEWIATAPSAEAGLKVAGFAPVGAPE